MQRVQMVGPKACANYCEAYNDCAPEDLPRFATNDKYVAHAANIVEEKQLNRNFNGFNRFMEEIAQNT